MCHQQKVADIFNILGTLSPSAMSEDHQDNTVESETNEAMTSSNEQTPTSDVSDVDEDDKDPEDALRTLSNMKKYKINNLCCQNLHDGGWSKLGANMEEDRRWTQMLQTQEREQIKMQWITT